MQKKHQLNCVPTLGAVRRNLRTNCARHLQLQIFATMSRLRGIGEVLFTAYKYLNKIVQPPGKTDLGAAWQKTLMRCF